MTERDLFQHRRDMMSNKEFKRKGELLDQKSLDAIRQRVIDGTIQAYRDLNSP